MKKTGLYSFKASDHCFCCTLYVPCKTRYHQAKVIAVNFFKIRPPDARGLDAAGVGRGPGAVQADRGIRLLPFGLHTEEEVESADDGDSRAGQRVHEAPGQAGAELVQGKESSTYYGCS